MKLFYAPAACSLSPHIVLREVGLEFELCKVDLRTKRLEDGSDFARINPKGYVPALQLDDGEVLTEGPAIVQYIADCRPLDNLAYACGSRERYRVQAMLNFITAEVHKPFAPLFKADTPVDRRQEQRDALALRFDYLETQIGPKPYIMGEKFTVADAYLFTVLNWTRFVNLGLGAWPALDAYVQRVSARPKVQEALQAEGLLRQQPAAVRGR